MTVALFETLLVFSAPFTLFVTCFTLLLVTNMQALGKLSEKKQPYKIK
jgi:hypothetical protein